MAGQKWISTRHAGVRYYQHPTRRHGYQPDKYYTIRFQTRGKRIEQGLGWQSDGATEDQAARILTELKKAAKAGKGITRLAPKREKARNQSKSEHVLSENSHQGFMSFGDYFSKVYYPMAQLSKPRTTWIKERGHFINWIKPVIGKRLLQELEPHHLERIKHKMIEAGRAPRTIQHVFATIRIVWNTAKKDGFVISDSPTKAVKLPRIDNLRNRYLTRKEAAVLMGNLEALSKITHDMALVSLYSGLRAGEIFELTWGCINIKHGQILVLNTSGRGDRRIPMARRIQALFKRMTPKSPKELVFLKQNGKPYTEIPQSFRKAVAQSGLNNGVSDPRKKVVFHTLRHTCAAWLIQAGADLYSVKEILGHATIAVTERYSHLKSGNLQAAVSRINA